MVPHKSCHDSLFVSAGPALFQWNLIGFQEHVHRKQISEIHICKAFSGTDLFFSVMEDGNYSHKMGLQQ